MYEDDAKLLFTDTDSLCYEINTDDFFKDISSDVHERFDTSNLGKSHPSGISTGVTTRLQKLHNRAARVIACVPNEVNQQTVLNKLGWEPLNEQRVKAKAKIMFKTLNNGAKLSQRIIYFQKRNIKPQSS
jgi:ribosomal protein S16